VGNNKYLGGKELKKLLLLALLMLTAMVVSNTQLSVHASCESGPEFCVEDGDGGGTPTTEGTLSIYSDGTTSNSSASSFASGFILGTHSFIHIENTGNTFMVFGAYYLQPGEDVTIGIYGNKDEHLGVWYNLEAYFFVESSAYSDAKGLSVEIDEDDVEIIDDYIDDNNTWSNSFNCASFAADIWNLVSTDHLDPYNSIIGYDTPKRLANKIDDISGFFIGIQFTVDSSVSDDVGYYGYTENQVGTFVTQLPS